MHEEDLTQLMWLKEVSAELKISENTLKYWRARGEGPPSFRIGRNVVYSRPDVLEWVRQQREATLSTRPVA